MYPLGHVALGYLLYVVYGIGAGRVLPYRWELVLLVIASQIPDIIDKPLAFYGILASGRSFGHSLIGMIIIAAGTVWIGKFLYSTYGANQWDRQSLVNFPSAFVIGYGSHLVGDTIGSFPGDPGNVRFLFWPILVVPRLPKDDIAPWIRLIQIYQNPLHHPQLELIIVALGVFLTLRVYPHARKGSEN